MDTTKTKNLKLSRSSEIAGFDNNMSSFSTAIGDTNNDGLTDIIVNNNNHTPFVWNNLTTTINNYIKVKLIGTTSNRDAIGSKIGNCCR